MEITPCIGIGDMIVWKIFSLNEEKEIKKIFLYFTEIKYYRTHPEEYLMFLKYFASKLFPTAEIAIIETYKMTHNAPLEKKIKNTCIYNLYSFNKLYPLPTEKYIIFHTKCRMNIYSRNQFDIERSSFIEFLDSFQTSKTIYILGEQEVDDTIEKKEHDIKSIYSDLLRLKKNNNVLDFTKPVIHNSNTIEDFEKDIQLIHNAEFNVNVGLGGNFVLCTAFAKKTIAYINENDNYYIGKLETDSVIIKEDMDEFCRALTLHENN